MSPTCSAISPGTDVRSLRKLLVAPDRLRQISNSIDNEVAWAGRMVLKMNSLVDVRMTKKLYEASQAVSTST